MTRPPEDVLREWRESAPFWEKHGPAIRQMFAPVTFALIEEAGIQSGHSVLDVAGGTGEPSLTIAETVGPQGSVISTDVIADMVAAARREAEKRNLANITFRQSPAESLPFDDASFDVVVSRLGAMFFNDVRGALSEMLRVTKPNGRISLAVWHQRERNPFFHAVTTVMSRYVEYPAEDPDAPGGFRFSESGKLAGILRSCGAANVKERLVDFKIEALLTFEEFWTIRSEMSDSLRTKMSKLSISQVEQLRMEVGVSMRDFFHDNQMSIPAQVLIVTGTKT